MGPNLAAELRRDLVDVRMVCEALGLMNGPGSFARQSGGVLVRCPWHADRRPSCSLQVKGGALVAHCFACDAGGDVFDLIAVVRGLHIRSDFRAVLVEAAHLASRFDILDAIEKRGSPLSIRPPPPPRPAPLAEGARDYPPTDELAHLWSAARPVSEDREVTAWLHARALDPSAVDAFDLARVLPDGALPRWARRQGVSWSETGHRCLLPVFDSNGQMRSVRGRLVRQSEAPKNLTPAGCSTRGLVLADRTARRMLETGELPGGRLVVAEGEPDHLTWATSISDADETPFGVLAIAGSGTWTSDIAARIPSNTSVVLKTHADEAGERYADAVVAALAARCKVFRRAR